MDISNIQDKDLARLEQACERYAVMAFEAINGRLAIDLKSIRYSYERSKDVPNQGIFSAEYIPTRVSDCPKKADRRMAMAWRVAPTTDGQWKLFSGEVAVQNQRDPYVVNWSDDGLRMVFTGVDGEWVHSPMLGSSGIISSAVYV